MQQKINFYILGLPNTADIFYTKKCIKKPWLYNKNCLVIKEIKFIDIVAYIQTLFMIVILLILSTLWTLHELVCVCRHLRF